MERKQCTQCQKSDSIAVLLKFPFTVVHDGVETSEEHKNQDSYLCTICLEREYTK